jgi:hypothetical protein
MLSSGFVNTNLESEPPVASQSQNVTAGDVATKGIVPPDTPTDAPYCRDAADTTGGAKYGFESRLDAPAVLRRPEGFVSQDEADRMLDTCQAVARRARDAFKEACEASSPDDAEASFLASKDKLEELWKYAHLRDRPFRDLLALLTAAIKNADLSDITAVQRDVLRQAFADLPKLYLDDASIEAHIDSFAEHAIDAVVSPIRATLGKRMKVTIEEIE